MDHSRAVYPSHFAQVPQVRLHAVAALERLADPGEDGLFTQDPITKAYRKLLEVERNKDVRKCILGVMPVVKGSTMKVRHIKVDSYISDAVLDSFCACFHNN